MSTIAPVPNEMLQAAPAATRTPRGVPGLRGTGALGHVCAAVIVVAVLIAVFGPLIAPYPPNQLNISYAFVGGQGNHLLGFDGQGRDLFSRLLVGARSSLLGPLLVSTLAVVTGALLAVAAAWIGGWFDATLAMVFDVLFAFPGHPAGRGGGRGVRAWAHQRNMCAFHRLPAVCGAGASRSRLA